MLTSALVGCETLALRSGHFTNERLSMPENRSGKFEEEEKKIYIYMCLMFF